MKAKHINSRKIIYERGQSFKFDTESLLPTSLHCHKEYELVYIRSGYGKEFIGDSVRDYNPNDLILIGSNLPHLYLSSSRETEDNLCDILQFPEDIFPQHMDRIPEYSSIYKVLNQSSQGIIFRSDKIKKETGQLLASMKRCQGIERLMLLLQLLNKLGKSGQYCLLSTLRYTSPLEEYVADNSISLIYSYLINNHKQSISINSIADYAKMNPKSICRHFKQKTGKTIFQCLEEIRVEYSCKLLGNTDLTISEIAFNSCFGNQSHFNKHFKSITGQTPSEYRRNREGCKD